LQLWLVSVFIFSVWKEEWVTVVLEFVLLMGIAVQEVDASPAQVPGASIRGSPAAMREQHQLAQEHGLPMFRTEEEILAAVEQGHLVELTGDANYEVADFVTLPYLIEEGRLFVERTAALYHQACGQRLVVTSAVRSIEEQPPNAHPLSVHPAGMAVDLRVSPVQECREWLENKFLALEQQDLLNGIRERRPPHYHVAIYPTAYRQYVEAQRVEGEVLEEPVDPREPAHGRAGVLIVLVVATLAMLLFLGRRWASRRVG
jgi:hypothetical protein